ncbi:Tetratricopeptide repeat protein [compost metagenome]
MGLFSGLFKKKEKPIVKKKDELIANSAKVSMEEMEGIQLFLKDKMDADEYNSAFNQACRMIPKGQYTEAIEVFESIRESSTDAYEKGSCDNQIGACHFFLGDFEKALEFYNKSFQSGYDKDVNDYNIWEACEELMKIDGNKAKWSQYYLELFPDGQYARKAKKNIA